MKTPLISRNVLVLSLVSLCPDISSEMLYPVMPLFLKEIGFSVLLIGILEGLAEATAGLSKGFFGQWSDRRGSRVPFIRVGYALSAVAKPMMALSFLPAWIFLARLLDRLGKGVRTAARDALLADEATGETKGRVFGFHRGADTLGAAIGPVLALLFLTWRPGDYVSLFLLAFLPGAAAVALTLFIRERRKESGQQGVPSPLAFFRYWATAPRAYRRLCAGLLFFTLFNSSDLFLLLAMKEAGMTDSIVLGGYVFYNVSYAVLSYPAGALADRIGLKTVLAGGFMIFAVVYAGMAVTTTIAGFVVLLLLYGLYAAATEGISKAWITAIVPPDQTATAVGTYVAFQSVFTMAASMFTGLIWSLYGLKMAFGLTAVAAVMASLYIAALPADRSDSNGPWPLIPGP
ncbi:MAG: MFS transporter [Syntrophales bacterium]|nr:MFS transporter [Syntrophales bacterium]